MEQKHDYIPCNELNMLSECSILNTSNFMNTQETLKTCKRKQLTILKHFDYIVITKHFNQNHSTFKLK